MRFFTAFLATALLCQLVTADIYLHNPRGSNDRLDEANRDRNNGNRVFDSQNNNRGGYNVGQLYYYVGSTLSIEWTAQHSCGDASRSACELVLQYACEDRLRDGTTTNTIPTNPNECYGWDCDTDPRFGRHESFEAYRNCTLRQRNKGLFAGSQNINGNGAQRTRQNPNGNRHGYECPEERDYYPYWQPTMWRDIAVLTNQANRCAAYKAESQNVKARYFCEIPERYYSIAANKNKKNQEGWVPVTQAACEAISSFDTTTNTTVYAKWSMKGAWNMAAPDCRENQWSRDNHHGNAPGSGGFPSMYNWTIPGDIIHERCALRLRYNITTYDMNGFDNATTVQVSNFTRSLQNPIINNPQANKDPARLDVWTRFGLNWTDVAVSFDRNKNDPNNVDSLRASREYVLKNNPNVDMFGSLLPNARGYIKHQLAINTAQYGRTFQDRSFKFAIRPRPAGLAKTAAIHNLNVKGKRGNIVQTYPGVEYDFVPQRLEMATGDYVHIQWTGSNTNPNNNAGQGKEGTDRHNIVALREKTFADGQVATTPLTRGAFGTYYPDRIDSAAAMAFPFLGLTPAQQKTLAFTNGPQFGGSMDELNDAGTYFDFPLQQVNQVGVYHYLCTRNNNFSNRNQQAKIVIRPAASVNAAIGSQGGSVAIAGAMVSAPAASFATLSSVQVTELPRAVGASEMNYDPGSKGSAFITVGFEPEALTPGAAVSVAIEYNPKPLHTAKVMYSWDNGASWSSHDADFAGGTATVKATVPGTFVVTQSLNKGAVAGIVIGIIVFLVAATGAVVFYIRKKRGSSAAAEVAMHSRA